MWGSARALTVPMSRLPKLILGWVICFCDLPSSEATAVIAPLPLFKIGVLLSAGL